MPSPSKRIRLAVKGDYDLAIKDYDEFRGQQGLYQFTLAEERLTCADMSAAGES
jgi:hypothetical protein